MTRDLESSVRRCIFWSKPLACHCVGTVAPLIWKSLNWPLTRQKVWRTNLNLHLKTNDFSVTIVYVDFANGMESLKLPCDTNLHTIKLTSSFFPKNDKSSFNNVSLLLLLEVKNKKPLTSSNATCMKKMAVVPQSTSRETRLFSRFDRGGRLRHFERPQLFYLFYDNLAAGGSLTD